MIFAVRPGNIHTVSKVISLLGAMHVIVALSPRKTCVQCTQCGEWSHKQENCAKRSRCFHYSSEKHSFDAHVCLEDKCSDGDQPCPHPPKCIVCAGLHKTDYENCPLKPKNAKTKGATKRPDGPEIARIRGQQKALRDWQIRDNRLQLETASKIPEDSSSGQHQKTGADSLLSES